MSFYKSRRKTYFPEITDWTDDQNQLRNAPAGKLTNAQFVWFSPTAYKIIQLGIPFCFTISFGVLGVLSYWKYGQGVLMWIFMFLMSFMLIRLIIEASSIKPEDRTNMYDIFLRDDFNLNKEDN